MIEILHFFQRTTTEFSFTQSAMAKDCSRPILIDTISFNVDYFSRFLEVFQLTSVTSFNTATALKPTFVPPWDTLNPLHR